MSTQAAETYMRLVAEAELRRRPFIYGPGPHPHRLGLAATALAAIGAPTIADCDPPRIARDCT